MDDDKKSGLSRRGFLGSAGGMALVSGVLGSQGVAQAAAKAADHAVVGKGMEPFYGVHQSGITTPAQQHTYFVALDLETTQRDDVIALLKRWTDGAARLARGEPVAPFGDDPEAAPGDSGDAIGLSPARLTVTFGFGPGLFTKDGVDRYGLASRRPEAFVDLPRFNGDQLIPEKTGGDLSIQACADDLQVAFHAVRQLVRLAYGTAKVKWAQTGFSGDGSKGTPRNLMGFKDGTANPATTKPLMDKFVWVGDEGPQWMRDGSYMVVRRIRIALEHWDRTQLGFQEEVVGRHKYSGAPLGKQHEFDAADFDATDKDGNLVVPETAHMRLASPHANNGVQILRRGYSYNDGVNFHAERWPPWTQAMEYDAGLLFVGYQKDPRTGFIPVNQKLAAMDMMNQYTTTNGSGIFACPPGVKPGSFIGADLFAA
ncbi:MAG: deferrochelatase/peroxidase EfeB [Burkholderiales bacterium]|nr:deferrochelatase/peroxidase EfeB [Burkholderiales bacterium]